MDGFAIDATEPYPLTVVGDRVFPEDEPPTIENGQAVRIATGGPLPERADGFFVTDSKIEAGENVDVVPYGAVE